MPEPTRIVVRDTLVDLLRAGSGPPLLFLHGAGGGGRWLTFQERLAERFDVLALLYRQNTALARVAWNPYLYNPLLRRRLARIATPTLLAWGAHDRLAPLQCAEAWRKEIPGAVLRVFDASGHVPHLEEPEAVAAAVTEFCLARKGTR